MSETPGFLFERLAATILRDIQNRKYPDGKLPPERELAESLNVNRITLRKALQLLTDQHVIHKQGQRGTFIGRAKKQAITAPKVIGLVLTGRTRMDLMHSATIAEMEQQLRAYHSQLMLFSLESEQDVASVLMPAVRANLVDGFALSGLTTQTVAQNVRDLGLPMVLMGHLTHKSASEETYDRVYSDSEKYGFEATKFLIKKDRTRVAYIYGPSYQWFLNALNGYMRALAEAGIRHDESLLIKTESDSAEAGSKAVKSLLKHKQKPDAIFVASERLCRGCVSELKQNGIRIPDDMEIITVGNEFSEMSSGVHAIRLCWKSMISESLKLLFERLKQPDLPPMRRLFDFAVSSD